MSKEFRKASDLVSALFSGLDVSGIEKANSFFRSWRDIVGEKIASHSRIVDVDRGAVIVEVDHPGWSQQIQFRKPVIMGTLSRNYPELGIKTLVIRVVAEYKETYKRPETPVGEGVTRVQGDMASDIPVNEKFDSELKDVLTKLKESIRKGKA